MLFRNLSLFRFPVSLRKTLDKLDEHLHKETGLPVMKAEEPLSSVVLGAGKLLGDHALLSRVAIH